MFKTNRHAKLTGVGDRREKETRDFKFATILIIIGCIIASPIVGLLLNGVEITGINTETFENVLFAFEDGAIDYSLFLIGFLIMFIVCIGSVGYLYMDYVRKKNSKPDEEHGNAKLMSQKDMVKWNQMFFYDPKICEQHENVATYYDDLELKKVCKGTKHNKAAFDACFANSQIMGQDVYLSMNPKFINRNLNTITIGGSGQGKSFSELFPNTLNANANYVFTDPSGEILQKTGHFLRDVCGYELKVFNVDEFNLSMKYNPLAYVNSDRDYNVMVDAMVENINMGNKSTGGNDFFEKAAKSLMCALCALLKELYAEREIPEDADEETRERIVKENEENRRKQNLSNVMNLLRMAQQETDEEGNAFSTLDGLFQKLEQVNPRSYAAKMWRNFQVGGPKVCNEVIISAAADYGRYFDTDDISWLTMEDELHLEDLASEKKCALFLIIPQSTKSYNFLCSMIYSQLFDITAKAGKKWRDDHHLDNPALPRHLSFWLDEFANIGKIPSFMELLSVVRKYNISINIIIQGMAQLKGLYPKDEWEIILANLDTMIYLGGMEPSTVKWLSDKMGKETIKSHNYTVGKNSSESYSNIGKALMSADEIEKMSRAFELVFISGCKPIQTRKYNLTEHPNYKYSGEADSKNNVNISEMFANNNIDFDLLDESVVTVPMIENYDFNNLVLKKGHKRGTIKEDVQNKEESPSVPAPMQEGGSSEPLSDVDKKIKQIAYDETLSDEEKQRRIKEIRDMNLHIGQPAEEIPNRFDLTTAEVYDNFVPEHEFADTDFDIGDFNLDAFVSEEEGELLEDSGAHVDDFGDDDDCFDSEASYDEDLPEDFGEEEIPEEVFVEE